MARPRLRDLVILTLLSPAIAGVCARADAQAPASARVETAPLELRPADRYQVPTMLEPSRRVSVMAQADGVVRLIPAAVGEPVKQGQELARLDPAEAEARSKVAQANVKLMQASVDAAKESKASRATLTQAEARLEAAGAEAEIARLALDRCTLKAPFAGRVLATPVDAGQYVAKGTPLVELADLTSLRVLIPVDRKAVKVGGPLQLAVEGRGVPGKVRAIVGLPEEFGVLRELAAPLAAAWIDLPNTDGTLEPGLRARSPWLPVAPIATVPARALRAPDSLNSSNYVQVIRAEYVNDVTVQVLGEAGPEMAQVSGAFRQGDLLIVSSSTRLAARTLIRFGEAGGDPAAGLEMRPPSPDAAGGFAEVSPPANPAVAPIGAPNSAIPRTGAAPGFRPAAEAKPTARPAPGAAPAGKAAAKPGSAPVPF